MPFDKPCEELVATFKAEMQECGSECFRAEDCFPFVFQNPVETTGVSVADRTELHRELMDWTRKIL